MNVADAKAIAREWVHETLGSSPNVVGALFHGSVLEMPDSSALAASSDIDIIVVRYDTERVRSPGKFIYRKVLLEVSNLAETEVATSDQVLSAYHLAGSFRRPGIILEHSGRLTELHDVVARDFAKARWVRARCEDAQSRVRRNLQSMKTTAAFHGHVTAWLFAGGVVTHVLLVAGLRNPTVRKRYVDVSNLLTEYGHETLYPSLLEMIGAADISEAQVRIHLESLSDAFDAASQIIRSPFFFAADISSLGRPVAIGGCKELIDKGLHREAVFWMVATYARCINVFHHDGSPELVKRHEPGFRALCDDLGIRTEDDLRTGSDRIEEGLFEVMGVANKIIEANPGISK